MEKGKFITEMKKAFCENSGCHLQDNGTRPCNTDFHAQEGDFKHICWLIVLGLSSDYAKNREDLIEDIRKELNGGKP
jgi:hypothetical protein